jgi:pimeloyl-ACP methyl ester carboxylesterase
MPMQRAATAVTADRQLPNLEPLLLPRARHYVQLDQPAAVARLLLAIPEC